MLVYESVYLPGSSDLLILLLLFQEALLGGFSLLVLSLAFSITSRTLSCQCILVATAVCSWNVAGVREPTAMERWSFMNSLFVMYCFSIWHVSPSSINRAAVSRDYLGRRRANLGAQATLRSWPCAGEPEESAGCGQTHGRASRARLQSQSSWLGREHCSSGCLPVSLSRPLKFLCSSWFKNWETLSKVA